MSKSTAVVPANLGLYFDRPSFSVPKGGLIDGNNFRISNGTLSNFNLGWEAFGLFVTLSGPVTLVDNFFLRSGSQIFILGSTKDLYKYDDITQKVAFITPTYATGTAQVNTGALTTVVGVGTSWLTNLKVGDEILLGSATETDPAAVTNGGWYKILTVDTDLQLTLTADYTGTLDSALTYTGRKLFTGDVFDYWRTETFFDAQPGNADLWFATNGVQADNIVKWDGITAQVVELSVTFTCKELAQFKNMLLYGNILEDSGEIKPTTIKNSDIGSPEDLVNGLAGEFVVQDSVDPILAMLPLGDDLVIYGQRSAVLTQFVGDPIVFVFRTAIAGVGPITGRFIADFGDFHEFVGADSQFSFDGVSLQESGTQLWREVLRIKDPNRLDLSFSVFDEENGDLIWAIPLTSDNNVSPLVSIQSAYSEHYLEETGNSPTPFSKRDFPFTTAGFFSRQSTLTFANLAQSWSSIDFRWNDQFFQAAFPFIIVGDEAGNVWNLGISSNANSAALASFVTFGRRVSGTGRERNMLRRLYVFSEPFPAATSYGLSVTIRAAEQASGAVTPRPVLTFDLTHTGNHFVSPFMAVRYFEVQFGTAGPSQPWLITGYDTDIIPGGWK